MKKKVKSEKHLLFTVSISISSDDRKQRLKWKRIYFAFLPTAKKLKKVDAQTVIWMQKNIRKLYDKK